MSRASWGARPARRAGRDEDERCEPCERTRRELHALRELVGLLVRGIAACVALLDSEQTEPTMPKRRLLAVLHHRLDHLKSQTDGRTKKR